MHPTHADFLRTIYANRDDDAPRLVYADWLEEQGNPYSEFIRVQIELAHLGENEPGRPALLEREQELLKLHEEHWRAGLPSVPGMAWGPFVRGFPETMQITEPSRVELTELEEKHPHFLRPALEALLASPANYPIHYALDYVPDCDCQFLIDRAMAVLVENPGNPIALTIITSAMTQFPGMLHKHLDVIFNQRILARTYYGASFWRESGQRHFPFLRRLVEEGDVHELRAWEAMLWTRDEAVISYALSQSRRIHSGSWPEQEFQWWLACSLAEVGLVQEHGKVRLLESPEVWHIMLPPEFYSGHFKNHPTRQIPSHDRCLGPMVFGGSDPARCVYCKEKLHHIITLDPVPKGIGIADLRRLTLALCLSCQLYEGNPPIFYEHDANGRPHSFDTGEARDPAQSVFCPLNPCQAYLADLGSRWFWQSEDHPPENIHRVGGPPSWIHSPAQAAGPPQSPGYPSCPRCKRAMSFLMQLGSGIPFANEEGEFAWSGDGTGYCFWCDACRVSCWVSQCSY